jgi:hypothetical protein
MMDYKDPEKVLEICAKATPGPWTTDGDFIWDANHDYAVETPSSVDNDSFVCLSRTALPYWVERARQLEAVAEVLKEAVPPNDVDWWCPTCKRVVDGKEVTYKEYHEICGTYLGGVNNDEWIIRAKQAIDALEGGK